MTLPLKPQRGGFLRPFGCAWFIREFLLGRGPNGSPEIDPNIGAPQADIFHHYKVALMKTSALDRATRVEERRAQQEKRSIDPENIERLAEKYLARMSYKAQGCRFHSFVVYFSTLSTRLPNKADRHSRKETGRHTTKRYRPKVFYPTKAKGTKKIPISLDLMSDFTPFAQIR